MVGFWKFLKGVVLEEESDRSKKIIISPDSGATTNTSMTITAAQTSDRVVTVPDATDTLVGKATSDTLTNKVLSGNTAASLINGAGTININSSGTVTVPNATDTLVGKATTDIFTNKSISGSTNTFSNIPNTATTATSANTASAIVSRDASGDFSAGIVTASLNGNATTATTAGNVSGVVLPSHGGTGIANDDAATLTRTGNHAVTLTTSATTSVTLPTAGTLSTLAGNETLTNKVLSGNTAASLINGSGTLNVNSTGTITVPNATDTLVGKATTDTLSNKTFGDAATFTQISTPSNPSSGFNKLYPKSDNRFYTLDSSGGERAVGSGSGSINYLSANPDAESSTTGWVTYADAAQSTPVDGTGGSPNITWTRSTTTPLRGNADFNFAKDAANRQGQGVSYDFTLDSADKGMPLSVTFDYEVVSGTYADTDLTVYLYDVTNAVVIQPSGYSIANVTVPNRHVASFQTNTTSTSYRFILHVASTSASAYTLAFDNFIVGPSPSFLGMAATDWASYTPVFTGWGTVTAINFRWRRVGDTLEIQGVYTDGTTTATEARISMPTGLTSDSSIGTVELAGKLALGGTFAGTANLLIEPSVTYFTFGLQGASNTGITKANGNVFASTQTYSLFARCKISGWSSNLQISSDTDTRVVSFQANTSTTAGSTATRYIFTAVDHDTHGAYNASTGVYTIPVPGTYFIKAVILQSNTASALRIRKNGTIIFAETVGTGATTTNSLPACGSVKCIAGDTIDVTTNAGATATGGATANFFSAFKLSGPAAIAASESINARYFASGTSISGSLATISWSTKDYDSHTGMSSGTYTVPAPGKYQVNSAILLSGTFVLNSTLIMEIQKNGSVVSRFTEYAGGAETDMKGMISDTISCLAGDTLRIQVSSSGTGPAIVASNFDNYISLFRAGN